MIQLLIILFLISLIPKFRDYFKKGLRKTFIVYGIALIIMQLIMSFFVYPRFIGLYRQSTLGYDFVTNSLLLVAAFLMSLFILIFSIKIDKFYKNNKTFYLIFGLLTIIAIFIIQIDVSVIINPIYALTTSFK